MSTSTAFFLAASDFLGRGLGGQQRQAVKCARLEVGWILLVEFRHRLGIRGGPLHVVAGGVVAVESGERRNVAPLTVGLGAYLLGFFHLAPAALQGRLSGTLPDLMEQTQAIPQ